jgi:hypothetical protein
MESDTFEAVVWAMRFRIGFHIGNCKLHKYLVLTGRFGETISTRAGPSTPHMTKTLIFGVSIKAFDFVIERSQARAHLPS